MVGKRRGCQRPLLRLLWGFGPFQAESDDGRECVAAAIGGDAGRVAPLGRVREPDLRCGCRQPHDDARGFAARRARRERRADCRPLRLRRLPESQATACEHGRARHPGDGTSRHGASDRHLAEAALPPRRLALLRARHLRHEGRGLSRARGGASAPSRHDRDEAPRHLPFDLRRGDRQPRHARPDHGRGARPENMCWCPSLPGQAAAS